MVGTTVEGTDEDGVSATKAGEATSSEKSYYD
jgi:hypothetical protein